MTPRSSCGCWNGGKRKGGSGVLSPGNECDVEGGDEGDAKEDDGGDAERDAEGDDERDNEREALRGICN